MGGVGSETVNLRVTETGLIDKSRDIDVMQETFHGLTRVFRVRCRATQNLETFAWKRGSNNYLTKCRDRASPTETSHPDRYEEQNGLP